MKVVLFSRNITLYLPTATVQSFGSKDNICYLYVSIILFNLFFNYSESALLNIVKEDPLAHVFCQCHILEMSLSNTVDLASKDVNSRLYSTPFKVTPAIRYMWR
jgi:hypothetical protein